MAKVLSSEEFEQEVLKSDVPVVVDFFTTWCGPCKMMGPVIEACDIALRGKAKVFKVDAEECIDIADKYAIRTVPTIIFYNKGEVIDTISGVVSKDSIINKVEELNKSEDILKDEL